VALHGEKFCRIPGKGNLQKLQNPLPGFPFGGVATAVIATIAVFLPMVYFHYPDNTTIKGGVMEEKKRTGRPRTHGTASERVQAWRLRNFRKVYRTEILLPMDDAVKLDVLCDRQGVSRSEVIRDLIRKASVSG